jgi:methyltransferase (TIGR00027 family)
VSAPIRNVSDTARWVAAYRALESAREDALFSDPFAALLAGDRGPAIAARAPRPTRDGWPVIARTKVIDDMALAAIREGCDRVISLAAGLDARPYRLELPASLPWIEADLPDMIFEKNAALAHADPRCALRRVAVDLADPIARAAFLDEALRGAERALVLTEGLVMYLTPDIVESLARDLARPAVAYWITDLLSPASRNLVMLAADGMLANAPMRFAPGEGVAFFEALGWRVEALRSLFDEARRFRRLPPLLDLLAMLPLPRPNPRRLGRAPWAGVVQLTPRRALAG